MTVARGAMTGPSRPGIARYVSDAGGGGSGPAVGAGCRELGAWSRGLEAWSWELGVEGLGVDSWRLGPRAGRR